MGVHGDLYIAIVGFTWDLLGFHGISWVLMEFHGAKPLLNVGNGGVTHHYFHNRHIPLAPGSVRLVSSNCISVAASQVKVMVSWFL